MKRLFTNEQELEIIGSYEAGESQLSLSRRYNVHRYNIRSTLVRHKTKLRQEPRQRRNWANEDVNDILTRYDSGDSRSSIAEAYSAGISAVDNLLRDHGRDIYTDPRYAIGEKCEGRWKGGRFIDGKGYVKTTIPRDHELYGYTGERRYILEHRLVMSDHLGRLLEQNETIHHVNGDKQDNRIENLQLRTKHHGPGARARCRCCGSEDIEYVDI